jgi:hypothetical protein
MGFSSEASADLVYWKMAYFQLPRFSFSPINTGVARNIKISEGKKTAFSTSKVNSDILEQGRIWPEKVS